MPLALRRLSHVLLACVVFALAPALARAGDDAGVFAEAWRTTQKRFYDRKLHGVDWPAVRDKYADEAEAAEDAAGVHRVINRMLAELKASHTSLIEKDVYRDHYDCEMTGRKTLQAGVEIVRRAEGYFVASVLDGGAAARAGVRKGDRVLGIDGEAPEEAAHLVDAGNDWGIPGDPHYFLRVKKDRPVRLILAPTEDEASLRTVEFLPGRINMIEASRASVRVLEAEGFRAGYVHLYHFLDSEIANLFERAVAGPLSDCDALVLDVRGRGGSPWVMNRVYQDVKRRWKKPVVLLVDEATRSAKEIFAYNFKRARVGAVVGRRTAGAVLGSEFIPLSDGSVLLLPVVDVPYLTGGVKLEGKGVRPDVVVAEPDEYTGGRDLVLERGLEELRARLAGGGAGGQAERQAEGL